MILRRIFITLAIIVTTSVVGSGLLILGNLSDKNISEVEIYAKENIGIDIEDIENSNTAEEVIAKVENIEPLINDTKSEETNIKNGTNYKENINNVSTSKQTVKTNISNNITETSTQNAVVEKEEKQVSNIQPKEDVYTFVRNDIEIQNMISITKRLIMENKENRYSGLVDNVNNINFIIEKSGNVFYPLYEYRIANIVMDNYYPEFYVYAEDVYKNGEYLRTEYYFQ